MCTSSCLKAIVVLCERAQCLPLFTPFHLGQSQNWYVNIEGASCLARPDASPGPRPLKDALHRSKCASLVPSLCHNIPFGLLASWSSLTFDRKVILMDPPNGESSRFDLRSVGPGFERATERARLLRCRCLHRQLSHLHRAGSAVSTGIKAPKRELVSLESISRAETLPPPK